MNGSDSGSRKGAEGAQPSCASDVVSMTIEAHNRTGLFIDAFGNGDVQLSFCFKGAKMAVLTGIPKRQARAIANRILHEIDYAEGRKARRPSSPHISYDDRVKHEPEYLKKIGVAS